MNLDLAAYLRRIEFADTPRPDRGTAVESRLLADDDELLGTLAETFSLRFPSGTRFNYRDDSNSSERQ